MTGADGNSREQLHARARAFIESPSFDEYYRRAHMPKAMWISGQLLRCITIVGLRGGLEGLAATRGRAFDSPELRRRYAELPRGARVCRAHVLTNAAGLAFGDLARGPALAVASLNGTDEGDAVASSVADQIVDRLFLEDAETAEERQVAAMIADERYVSFRKRALPFGFCGGKPLNLLDIWVDTSLLGCSLMKAQDIYVLVDPAPHGLSILVPGESRPAAEQDEAGR
jgi:hypothetical protein